MCSRAFSLAIVGTGLHGTHLATSIVEAELVPRSQIVLIDPWEENLTIWDRRVRNCGMAYLRSPASHGLAPDFRELRRMMHDGADWIDPYHRPAVSLFRRHAADRINRFLSGVTRVQARVNSIRRDRVFRITVSPPGEFRGSFIPAKAVILCPGMPPPRVPDTFSEAVSRFPENVHHVFDPAFNPSEIAPGDRVLVVGGGISALNLSISLAERAVSVTVWSRSGIPVHQFDSDPCFIGPRCGNALDAIDDACKILQVVRDNRRPGSVPPDLYDRFTALVHQGLIRHEYREATAVQNDTVRSGPEKPIIGVRSAPGKSASGTETEHFERVVLATGFSSEPPAQTLVERISRGCEAPITCGGYPDLEKTLAWCPGLFVTGGLADLVLGPPARNIIGAHLARRRILPALRTYLLARRTRS